MQPSINKDCRYMVEIDGIRKIYNPGTPDESTIFDGFTLRIRPGDFVSVIGSNGSGKTTLLNLLCGSIPPDGGTIRVGGADLKHMPEFRRAQFIGRVFQDPAKGTCAGLTVLENMSLADGKGRHFGLTRGVNRGKTDTYRAMVETLGLGLENRMNQTVGSMSGGQRQALALLIATMTPIDLLILDEHTAALDPKAAETVMELTAKIVKEKRVTTLMVTHNLKYAIGYGNRLLMLHEGRAVVDAADGEKAAYTIDDLLKIFNEISIEAGN